MADNNNNDTVNMEPERHYDPAQLHEVEGLLTRVGRISVGAVIIGLAFRYIADRWDSIGDKPIGSLSLNNIGVVLFIAALGLVSVLAALLVAFGPRRRRPVFYVFGIFALIAGFVYLMNWWVGS